MSNTGVINIRGKEYQTVALRVQKFREAHPDWSLTSEVVYRDTDCVVMKSIIADENGRIRATGHAEEYRKSSQINNTSALENAETSAHGRSLAALGMGGTEFASANEVQNAIQQQEAKPKAKQEIRASRPKDELLKVMADNVTPQMLAIFWSALKDDERELIRDEVAKYGTKLKEAQNA